MSAGTSAILIAAVGVLGTLLAPIVSQGLSARARRSDFALEKSQRDEEYRHAKRDAELDRKRACYISLTATSRQYRVEVMNYLFSIKRGTGVAAIRASLEEARNAFTVSLAEAQMTASLAVLSSIDPVRNGLARGYGQARQLEDGVPAENGSFEELQEFLEELWDEWRGMREAMRHDVGVDD